METPNFGKMFSYYLEQEWENNRVKTLVRKHFQSGINFVKACVEKEYFIEYPIYK